MDQRKRAYPAKIAVPILFGTFRAPERVASSAPASSAGIAAH